MSWSIKATLVESCSCAAICPCLLGPAKPDQEWCSGAIGVNVLEGRSDDIDLSGAKVVLHAELQGDFTGGIDKAKLIFDSSTSDDQRRELEAIFQGKKGGLWEGLSQAISTFVPSAVTKVDITDTSISADGFGTFSLEPVVLEDGTPTTLAGSPIMAAFGQTTMNVNRATGSFDDPDLRSWSTLGHGAVSQVEWSS